MKKTIVINGQFSARRMTGQERFAYQLVKELDKYVVGSGINMKLVVPRNANNIPEIHNIELVEYGSIKGSLWEQICFAYYCLSHHCLSLNLCSVMPLLCPGIICIHDLSYKVNPQYFKTFYAKVSQIWHKIQYYFAWRFSPLILTVSNYSKKQMESIYRVDSKKIKVICNGWEHFVSINEDTSILVNDIYKKPFFFSLGSLAPNKNIEWILEASKQNPSYNFIIAGNASLRSYGNIYNESQLSNVYFIGYISDEKVKTLMKHCEAFLFPSYFEGFGIPPLEALSVGSKIIVSKASCLPEIFGKSVYYIDPYNTNVNLKELLDSTTVEDGKDILSKYTYANSAIELWKILLSFIEQ